MKIKLEVTAVRKPLGANPAWTGAAGYDGTRLVRIHMVGEVEKNIGGVPNVSCQKTEHTGRILDNGPFRFFGGSNQLCPLQNAPDVLPSS